MKMLLTMTVGSVLLLPATAMAAPPAPVQTPAQTPKAVQAPAQAPAKTAQADTGYRTYSYQPGTMSSANAYRSSRPRSLSGFYPAGYKITPGLW
jgi:hypothetical protein